MTIAILKPDCFKGQLTKPETTGVNPIFRGRIAVNDESYRCYIKPIPDTTTCHKTFRSFENRELISEAIGYLLAKHSDIPVPEVAGIIALNIKQIPHELHQSLAKQSFSNKLQDVYLCWFTVDTGHQDTLKRFNYSEGMGLLRKKRVIGRIVDHITGTIHCSPVLAFDDWLINSDRNLGNLLITENGLMAIDHGRIFAYHNWQPGFVGANPEKVTNKLEEAINSVRPTWCQMTPNLSARALAYNGFTDKFNKSGEASIRNVLKLFFDAKEADQVVNLIQSLTDKNYQSTIGLLI